MSDEWEIYYDIDSSNVFKIHIDFKTSATGYELHNVSYTMVISKYVEV